MSEKVPAKFSETGFGFLLGLTGLALPAVGCYILYVAETKFKNDADKTMYNILLALGISFIIYGSGNVMDLASRLLSFSKGHTYPTLPSFRRGGSTA